MLAKRIIPCLDVNQGRTVKGINFLNLIDAGDPVELAIKYAQEGADELLFLDISASSEKRKTTLELVNRVASAINIPFTVGGGISSLEDAELIIKAGADKVSINSSAIKHPTLITEIASRFGSQCVVVAIDSKIMNNQWRVFIHGGRTLTDLNLFDWSFTAASLGAGEILFTSMDHDGTKSGFAKEALARLNKMLKIPVIASGGAGSITHFVEAIELGKADAVLAASVFHFNEIKINELKMKLKQLNIPVRL